MLGGHLTTDRNGIIVRRLRQSAAQWLSDAATYYFRPEAYPGARTTLRESDEERPCSDTADAIGNDPNAAGVLGSACFHLRFLLPSERFCDFASAIDEDLRCGAEGPVLQSNNSIRPELNW
jgi:hypothetical protein